MLCISIKRFSDGYTIIQLTDCEGVVCSYCGFDNWSAHQLQAEYGISI